MVQIIRPIENTDWDEFRKIYKSNTMINEDQFQDIINSHENSYVLCNTKIKKIYGVILSNTIMINNINISCYTMYYDKIKNSDYKILVNYYLSKCSNSINFFFRLLNDMDLENKCYREFVKDINYNDNNDKNENIITYVLHDNALNYLAIRIIQKYIVVGKLNSVSNSNSVYCNLLQIGNNIGANITMNDILNIMYPIEIRQLQETDYQLGLEKLMAHLDSNNNVATMEEKPENIKKCKYFINQILNNNMVNMIVLVKNNEIIGSGTIYYQPKLHRSSLNIEYAAFLEDIVIYPTYRGLGLGQFLTNYLVTYAKAGYKTKENVYKVSLNCTKQFCKFYEKSNLTIKGYQMNKYFNL